MSDKLPPNVVHKRTQTEETFHFSSSFPDSASIALDSIDPVSKVGDQPIGASKQAANAQDHALSSADLKSKSNASDNQSPSKSRNELSQTSSRRQNGLGSSTSRHRPQTSVASSPIRPNQSKVELSRSTSTAMQSPTTASLPTTPTPSAVVRMISQSSADSKREGVVQSPKQTPKSPGLSSPDPVYYAYCRLKSPGPYPKGVDVTRREDYLSPDAFRQVFGVSREAFRVLSIEKQKKWKKQKDML